MERDPIRICELLVGLPEVAVLGVIDEPGEPLIVAIETRGAVPVWVECEQGADLKDRDAVDHVDLAMFGRPARLRWIKRRFRCLTPECSTGSWTEVNDAAVVHENARATVGARLESLRLVDHGTALQLGPRCVVGARQQFALGDNDATHGLGAQGDHDHQVQHQYRHSMTAVTM